MRALVSLTLASLALTACAEPQQPSTGGAHLSEITSRRESEDFVDLTFRIRSHVRRPDGRQEIVAVGVHQGKEVGVSVALGPTWTDAKVADVPLTLFRGDVALRSVGLRSDVLLKGLDALFGTELRPGKLREETSFTGISLEGEPAALDRGPAKIKLFFEAEAEDRYAEWFLDIDLAKGELELNEKDREYRRAIVLALRQE